MENLEIKILIADDEKDILEILSHNLTKHGYRVITASDGAEVLEKLSDHPQLILLDVMMPKMDGYQVCQKIRETELYKNVPIIFLTAKAEDKDEIYAFSIGANDFIRKPISIEKILARVKSILRTAGLNGVGSDDKNIKIGPLVINKDKYSVILNDKHLDLPRKEFEILYFLASNSGTVFSRQKIMNHIWGENNYAINRTVDVHLLNIRKKLGEYGNLIETIRGVGYRFGAVN